MGTHRGASYDREGRLAEFAASISALNVAGSREAKEPGVYKLVKATLEGVFLPAPRSGSWLGGPGEG